ncbi:unnamed protein product [Trichogramma brassicae]|uniref:Uncharacterized protein n=1 Tax=Trichogramma brassicae TaxID=86971 RepID=A0A6H5IJJ0_9HYME|nr:unnamed protein product [Trichogramma brassicae]
MRRREGYIIIYSRTYKFLPTDGGIGVGILMILIVVVADSCCSIVSNSILYRGSRRSSSSTTTTTATTTITTTIIDALLHLDFVRSLHTADRSAKLAAGGRQLSAAAGDGTTVGKPACLVYSKHAAALVSSTLVSDRCLSSFALSYRSACPSFFALRQAWHTWVCTVALATEVAFHQEVISLAVDNHKQLLFEELILLPCVLGPWIIRITSTYYTPAERRIKFTQQPRRLHYNMFSHISLRTQVKKCLLVVRLELNVKDVLQTLRLDLLKRKVQQRVKSLANGVDVCIVRAIQIDQQSQSKNVTHPRGSRASLQLRGVHGHAAVLRQGQQEFARGVQDLRRDVSGSSSTIAPHHRGDLQEISRQRTSREARFE